MKRLEKGNKIDVYELLEFKGEGATAHVWSARSVSDQEIALKIFAPRINLDNYSKDLLKEEYDKTKDLIHNKIVAPYSYIEYEGTPILVMELCQNSLWEELKHRLSERRIRNNKSRLDLFSEKEIALILRDIGEALEYLHSKKLIHHDLKPANILSKNGKDGTVFKLTDFGITKEIRNTILHQTKSRNSSLTLAYAAPERLNGESNNKVASDIFSLGCTIYEITNGINIPPGEILNNNGVIKPLDGNYSKRLKDLVLATLNRDSNKRPTGKELVQHANYFLENGYWGEFNYDLSHEDTSNVTKVYNPTEQIPKKVAEDHQVETAKADESNSVNKTQISRKKTSNFNGLNLIKIAGAFILAGFLFMFLTNGNEDPSASSADTTYDKIGKFINGYACVQHNGKCGIINEDYQILKEIEYQTCYYKDQTIILKTNDSELINFKTN